ncbi:MAG TPA: MBL fold metallo-hydrolase [Bryobacteraceae bacterium]|nr:MBL fold metallo-hydrolase [Bryobacteraceae bacterium]
MPKSFLIRLSAALVCCGGAWIAYTQAPQPSKLTTIKLTDDLYVIHNDYVPGNTTCLITNEGVILVDDKFPQDADNIVAEVKKLSAQPIKYVISTHHHGDHTGGNPRLQQLGAQVISTEEARQNMIDGKQPGLPAVTFEHHASLWLGGKDVEMYHFGRAHTNGDAVVLFPAQRVLAAGDMFTYGDDVPELIDYAGGGSGKEWTSTLDSALKLNFDRVVPGHGNVTTRQEMQKYRQGTLNLRNSVHEMIVQKKTKADVEKMLRSQFHFADLHVARSLDGLMVEMQ